MKAAHGLHHAVDRRVVYNVLKAVGHDGQLAGRALSPQNAHDLKTRQRLTDVIYPAPDNAETEKSDFHNSLLVKCF